ncbi:amino acid permease, partial [bacterium]|nr:amino acid permease [bacterium]
TVAVGWSGYVVSFLKDFGISVPAKLAQAPLSYSPTGGWHLTGALLNVPAMAIIGIISFLLYIGVKESIRVNTLIVAIKLTVILLFIGFGLSHVNVANFSPFIPENTGVRGIFGWSGVFRAAAVIFFAYIGFDAVSTAAQECKNPQRDLPIGILGSLAISTILYILVAYVLTGVVHYSELNVPDPIAVGVNAMGSSLLWLRPLIKMGAICGLSSVILVMLMGQTRIFFAMASDGFLPKGLAAVHPKFLTPSLTTLITGIASMVVAGLFPIGLLGELVSIGTLFAFAIVCAGILILRKTRPDLPRPFKTPLVPLVPILGIITAVAQMASLPKDTWFRLVVWMILGGILFMFYGRKVDAKSLDVFKET